MNKLLLIIILLCFGQKLFAERPDHSHSISAPLQLIYSCPMHPEVKSNKPGNCPKCGMKLVAQKATKPKTPAPAKKAPAAKPASPAKKASPVPAKKTTPAKKENMDGMTMPEKKDAAPAPVKPVSKPADGHEGHQMPMAGKDSMEGEEEMDPMKIAKANLGPIKTIRNNTPPRTVRYDLYIADTTVISLANPNVQLQ